jgi:drug/metabolite transporter (DMT)-like permease
MNYLLASLLLLACTPMIVQAVQRYRKASQILAFILVVGITYTIVTHIIVESLAVYGWGAIVAALAGVIMLGVGDDYFFSHPEKKSWYFLALVQVFLFSHAMIDGAALVSSELPAIGEAHHHAKELSMSVLLHRMLFEVFLWKYFDERYGRRMAMAVLINVALGTVIGFFLSHALFAAIPSYFGLFEAFIGGALLHLVYDYLKERLLPGSRQHATALPGIRPLTGDKAETHGHQRPSSPS